jgi:CRP/FNR family transcriptional regulator, cyclic AMP receptor protein
VVMTGESLQRYRKNLADSVVFERLRPMELDLIIASSRLVEAAAGQMLLTEGKKGEGLYIVLEGEIEVFLPEHVGGGALRRPSRIHLNRLGPGRCFGEYGVIDDQPSSASARALASTRLCLLTREDFRRLAEEHDRIGKKVYANLLRFLIGRLRSKDKELDLIVFTDAP